MPKYILFIFLVFISLNLKAQNWELGIGAGGAGYMGDLNAKNPVKVSGALAAAFIRYTFDGYWALRFNATAASIAGYDSKSGNQEFRNRNLNFQTNLSEFSVIGEFNFMQYIPQVGTNKFTPYLYAGAGLLNYNPTTVYQGQRYNLRDLKTEGQTKPYPKTAIAFPYGFGVKYNIFNNVTLGADIGYRNPNTDYLDDVSGLYADKSKFTNPAARALSDRSGENTGNYIGSSGTQRGDLNPHDTYFFTQITISFTFIFSKCYY